MISAFSTLRDFAQRVGADEPESIKGQPKLAEAQNLMEWLTAPKQELAPATSSPKGPAVGGKKNIAPVEAHFVGDKACAGCHAPLIAGFKKTSMGRISLTQPASSIARIATAQGLPT